MDGEEWREGEERERKQEEEVRVTGGDGRMVEEGKKRRAEGQ